MQAAAAVGGSESEVSDAIYDDLSLLRRDRLAYDTDRTTTMPWFL